MAAPWIILLLLCSIEVVVRAEWIYYKGQDVCIHMTGNISVTVTKDSEVLERITEWELENIESSCDFVSCDNSAGKGLNAQLSLWSTYSDATLNFTFTGVCDKGSQKWSLVKVSVMIYSNETVITADDSETWAKTQYTRSYSCNHMIDYTEGIVNNKSLEVKFSTSNWRVQAFQFLNQTSGKYDNAQQCTQDSTGTVLVPIVVAVALGVLIIVVVAAYLVSYVYHRKKSGSYAALN